MKKTAFKMRLFLGALIAAMAMSACSTESAGLKDGYYTAESSSFNRYGWKEFITIYVNSGIIVTAEYDAKNASGFVRSWDMDSMRRRYRIRRPHPNKYARAYTVALLNRQDPGQIQVMAGAEYAHESFCKLAEAAISQARAGDEMVVFVDLPYSE